MKKIRVALISDSVANISPHTKKGTEIFTYIYLTALRKFKKKECLPTLFGTGNSIVPAKIESIVKDPTTELKGVGEKFNFLFEMLLIDKAIKMQSKFDIFHINIGNGEYIVPFAGHINRPIIVTMHGTTGDPYRKAFFSAAKPALTEHKNLHFVSISQSQRKHLPYLPYVRNIYHGIDVASRFTFNPKGGEMIVWTGRAVPEKGLDAVLDVAKETKKKAKIFPIIKREYIEWLHDVIIKKRNIINQITHIQLDFDVKRSNLVKEYQTAKLFLFPLGWEEPFGFTVIESMACGTPVIAYANGALPEIVVDGKTGFLVNSSPKNIRGDWIIKKTGVEGLTEAVERIYAMKQEDYLKMRMDCRAHVEKNFTAEHMVNQYIDLYREVIEKKNNLH